MPKFLTQIDMTNQRIINVADPSTTIDVATKQYVDNYVQGLAFKDEVMAATTANGTLASAYANGQSIDGYALVTGDRILIKNQSTASENGIYLVNASGAPTRATDADSGAELRQATVRVANGTVNGNTQWTCNNTGVITLGTTGLTFVASGTGTTYTAGNGLTGGPAFAVLPNGTSLDVSSSGVKIADAAGGNGLTVSNGILAVGAGTGVSVAADAVGIDTAIVVRKYAANVGNGSLTSIAVTHNLGTRDITWSVQNATTYEFVMCDATATDANTLTLTFATAPASNAYRVVVHG